MTAVRIPDEERYRRNSAASLVVKRREGCKVAGTVMRVARLRRVHTDERWGTGRAL